METRPGSDEFTRRAWDAQWRQSSPSYDPEQSPMLADALALLHRVARAEPGRFLEAGCGPAATALNLSRAGWEVAGVDLSDAALATASAAFSEEGREADLRKGDVRDIPWPDDAFDLLYAGGVVEHFTDTETALREFHRVLAPAGVAAVTVPAVTLSWPYLFLRGNVPAVGRVERLVASVQFDLLRGRLAAYGYERSFTSRRLRRMMLQAGFPTVSVECFETYLPLPQLPSRLRPAARRLASMRAFCPMWVAIGVKASA